jgi:mono/diheme cytochrome c family protein
VVYPAVTCDTTTVRLSVELENIMAASCYSCHSGTADLGGGIVLTDYATIKDYADFGILMSCLIQDGSTSAMPKGGAKLSDCEINKFSAWVNRGAPQN